MHYLTILIAVLVIVGHSQQACPTTQFQYCQKTLADLVGLNSTMAPRMFTDYTVMYNWFLYKWGLTAGDITHILKVCNSLEIFTDCMANSTGCLTIENLARSTDLYNPQDCAATEIICQILCKGYGGENIAFLATSYTKKMIQAFFISGTLAMYSFNCGPGINTLLHEGLSYAQQIISKYQNYLRQCVATYMSSIVHDSNHGCRYVSNLVNCWSAPFGGNVHAASPDSLRVRPFHEWWACEANRVFTLGQFPSCGYSCDVHQQSLILTSHLETYHKIEDDIHFYKIPDYVTKINGKTQWIKGAWMKN